MLLVYKVGDKLSGWISIHRKIREHWIYKEKRIFSKFEAWIDILLDANYQDNKILFDGQLLEVKRGQMVTSETKLADRWGWSRKKVRNFIDLLENDEMITKMVIPNKCTILEVNNYNDYQKDTSKDTSEDTTSSIDIACLEENKEQQEIQHTEQPRNNRGTTEEQLRNTNNKDNNINKDNKEIYTDIFEHWNSKKIIQHRKLTDKMKTKIKVALKDYGIETLKEIIDTYAEIVNDDKYWFTYKWSLEDFLQRGLKNFEDGEVARNNYLKDEHKTKKSKQTQQPKTKFHNFEQRTSKMSADDLEEIARRKREYYFEKTKKEEKE